MTVKSEHLARFELEYSSALRARRMGLEGRTRVCARRAAASAVRYALARDGSPVPSLSDLAILKFAFESDEFIRIKDLLIYFLEQVDPAFNLPSGIDLVDALLKLAVNLRIMSKNEGNDE